MSSELKVSFSNRSTLTTIDFWPSNKLDQFYPNIFSRFGTHFWIGSGIYLEQGKPMSYILLYLPTYLPTYLGLGTTWSEACILTHLKSFHLFFKMGQRRPLLYLFLVFSNKQYNFCNKSMWKNRPSSIWHRIQTHNLSNMSHLP